MNILSREEMYFFDKYTIENIGIPGKVLMENAGLGCSKSIQKDYLTRNNKIALFCGSGNNGGDGFVIARYLKEWKHKPFIFLTGKEEKMTTETLENLQLCRELDIPIFEISSLADMTGLYIEFDKFDLIVDAIFGVGFHGIVRGWISDLIQKINKLKVPLVAIDISSGIDANTGQAEIALTADKTYTMAAFKRGHFLEKGREKSGTIEVIDIGIPENLYEKFLPEAKLITEKNVKYPVRKMFTHKGNYGRIGIIAGSPGFSGAAILSAQSALRAGGGLITLFHPEGMELIFETQLLEVMTFAMPKQNEMFNWEIIQDKLSKMDVLLIGPGLGTSPKAEILIKEIIEFWEKPLVIDADGLNLISQNPDFLLYLRKKPVILTPHIGEFARLTNKTIKEILQDPMEEIKQFAQKYKVNILLKSATSIFTNGKRFSLNISGNDGLSTGGSGDVLSGIIISFLGQKLDLENAAISASYLLGKTAEKLAEKRRSASIIPSDISENLFVY